MLVALKNNDFMIKNMYINEKVPNNIIKDSDFFRLSYNFNNIILNGTYLFFELQNVKMENVFNKVKFSFSQKDNKQIIEYLNLIEKQIICFFQELELVEGKIPILHIHAQLKEGFFKIFSDKDFTNKFVLKISGLWSNKREYGVSYKFFSIN